jgi:hypothetical protein
VYKNIVVTTANSIYYNSLLTLISGIHLFGENCVNQIYVYNLGLDDSEVQSLNRLENVTVVEYSKNLNEKHLKFLDPKSYVYKSYCLENSAEYGENVFWLDAGTTPINEMCGIFDIIQSDEVFLVVDVHKIGEYTHSDCIKIMSATNEELNEKILSSGICGFKTNGKYRQMIRELFDYSMIPGCCDGDQENHRHDQSVLSILATRYKCPKQDIDIYGYWTDFNRNLQTAINNNAVIFVHRRGHHDISGLKYKNEKN